MKLLILRHLESEKNETKSFSSDEDSFPLTAAGRIAGKPLAMAIKKYIDSCSLNCSKIHIAKSTRARETAEILMSEIGNREIVEWEDLRSTNGGIVRGLSEKEAEQADPTFMAQLRLFRCGLFSSYNFEKGQREDKRKFEKRVSDSINEILKDDKDSLKIVIVHHSTLTAIMIHYARLFYGYPNDFYGKVDCGLGCFYLIDLDAKCVEFCNADYRELGKKYVITCN